VKKFLIVLIFLLSSFLRLYCLDKVPPSLFSDEVDLGYQAYSFLKTGKDYFGNSWPISFHSFADFRAPLYIYSAAGTIAIFGLNEWGVRLPAAIYGILGIVAFFLLIKEISNNVSFSLLATFFLSITPWHFHYSRAGFEATAIFFLTTLGLWLFFKSLKKRSFIFFVFSLFFLSLGFYTYAIARLFLPLLGVAAFFIFKKDILDFGLKKNAVALLIVAIVLLPFLKDSLLGQGLHRFSYLNIFSDSNLKFEIDRQRLVDTIHGREQVVGMKTTPLAYFFHNKPTSWAWTIINNYFLSFSTSFLFLKGDLNLRHGVGNFGGILVFMAPFFVLGIIKFWWLIKERKTDIVSFKQALFWLIFLLLSPIPSSITYDGGTHATRLFLMIIPLIILITAGVWDFFSFFRSYQKFIVKIFFGFIISLNSLFYFHQYFYHFPIEAEKFWHAGFKEGMTLIKENENSFDKIIMSNTYEPPLIFFLFWTRFDPKNFSAQALETVDNDWFEGKKLGKYYFGRVRTAFQDRYLVSLAKEKNIEKILILSGRNDFGGDLENGSSAFLKIIKKIYLPSKQPIFFLVRTRTFQELQNTNIE